MSHTPRSIVRLTTLVCTNAQAVVITMPDDSQSVINRENPYAPLSFNPYQKNVRQDHLRVKGTVFHNDRPAIPGTSLRGTLRDAITTTFLRDLHWVGQTFDSQNLNYKGGVKPAGKERLKDRLVVRQFSPLLSLFGACDPGMIAGRVNVGYVFLKSNDDTFQLQKFSVQRGVANERNDQLEQLEPDAVQGDAKKAFRAKEKEIEDAKKALRDEQRKAKTDADKQTIKDEITALDREFETFKSNFREENGTEVELRYITPADQITLGIPAHHDFDNTVTLEGAIDEEIGLFLKGMREVSSRELKVGGWGARGAGGMFTIVYKIEFYDNKTLQYVEDGDTLQPGPLSQKCIAAYEQGLAEDRYLFDVKSVLAA